MIITIVSPIKNAKVIKQVTKDLQAQGHLVLTPITEEYDKKYEDALMQLHKHKIAMSTKIVVVTVAGYMGRGTYEEIGYANTIGKKVEYLDFKEDVEDGKRTSI